jgi:hypothetical protein
MLLVGQVEAPIGGECQVDRQKVARRQGPGGLELIAGFRICRLAGGLPASADGSLSGEPKEDGDQQQAGPQNQRGERVWMAKLIKSTKKSEAA